MCISRCVLASLVGVVLATTAAAQEPSVFAGKWTGDGENSLGEKGKTTIELNVNGNGKLSGTWTYAVGPDRDPKSVRVTETRLSKTMIELRGGSRSGEYQITATVKDGEMRLRYSGKRIDATQGFKGEGRLTRE